jgi:hypothetical protein
VLRAAPSRGGGPAGPRDAPGRPRPRRGWRRGAAEGRHLKRAAGWRRRGPPAAPALRRPRALRAESRSGQRGLAVRARDLGQLGRGAPGRKAAAPRGPRRSLRAQARRDALQHRGTGRPSPPAAPAAPAGAGPHARPALSALLPRRTKRGGGRPTCESPARTPPNVAMLPGPARRCECAVGRGHRIYWLRLQIPRSQRRCASGWGCFDRPPRFLTCCRRRRRPCARALQCTPRARRRRAAARPLGARPRWAVLGLPARGPPAAARVFEASSNDGDCC